MRKLVLTFALAVAALGANAAVVYRNSVGQGDVVEFHDTDAKWCPVQQGLKQVVWNINAGPRKGQVVQGCYQINGDVVYMVFEDGDQYAVPLKVIQGMHERGGT